MNKFMKMILTVAIMITAVTGTAFAYDNSQVSLKDQYDLKVVVLENQSQFNVSLEGTSLVFKNVPKSLEFGAVNYDELYVSIINPSTWETVRDYTHSKSSGTSFNVSLAGLSGVYAFQVDYKLGSDIIRSAFTCVSVSVSNGTAKFIVGEIPGTYKGMYLETYRKHIQHQMDERKDAYALNDFKSRWVRIMTAADRPRYQKQLDAIMKTIPAGSSDIVKVKAIADYVYKVAPDFNGVTLDCVGATNLTLALTNLAGIPAKMVSGSTNEGSAHEWTHIWLDGRWMTLDALWYGSGGLDMPSAQLATNRRIGLASEEYAWDGSVQFYAVRQNKFVLLKTVPNFPIDGLLKETYGFNAANLYKDANYTIKFNVATDKISAGNFKIIVKETAPVTPPAVKKFVVAFNTYGGTAVKAVTVNSGSKLVKPAAPTRKGYKFVNWYKDAKLTKVWNFSVDKVTANTTIYAGWKK